jgi:uncharacterized protein (DUF2062 family)
MALFIGIVIGVVVTGVAGVITFYWALNKWMSSFW